MSNLAPISPTVMGPPARWFKMRRRGSDAIALKALFIVIFLNRKISICPAGVKPAATPLAPWTLTNHVAIPNEALLRSAHTTLDDSRLSPSIAATRWGIEQQSAMAAKPEDF